ncbi:MAG: ROK family protein [Candidatus Aenigmarchaeota archaeon]|nr:ROK family protein [Candidatus Aenigmarchaeota archaeon]
MREMVSSVRSAVGVDLGATNVRVAVGDERGNILLKLSESVEIREGAEGISRLIIRMIHSVMKDSRCGDVKGLAIGSIGPLDLERGGIIKPANLPFDYVPLTEPLRDAFNIPAHLLNDCTTGVIGERYFGAGKETSNLVYITLSTGIGGGIYVDDHLLIGKDGNAHEIGHLTIDFEGRLRCGCGKRGHWEAYCSGKNLPNYVRMILGEVEVKEVEESLLMKRAGRDPKKISARKIYDSAKEGDLISLEIVRKVGRLNAIGFANVVNAYDPSLITVGGTMTLRNTDLIMEPIKKHIDEYTINRLPEITVTPLGEDAVLYGAIAMVHFQAY